jgi:Family of unknown function (DUF6339)
MTNEAYLLQNAGRYIGKSEQIDSTDLVRPEQPIPLDAFDDAVAKTMSAYKAGDTSADGYLAPLIHEALPLSRRLAGDRRLWHWLTVVHRPQYVEHRWGSKGTAAIDRYLGGATRNTFGRLWWITELTKDRNSKKPYDLTLIAFGKQEFTVGLFDRSFMQYPPAMKAALEELQNTSGPTVQEVGKQLVLVLGTLVLEDLDETQLHDLVGAIRNDVAKAATSKVT